MNILMICSDLETLKRPSDVLVKNNHQIYWLLDNGKIKNYNNDNDVEIASLPNEIDLLLFHQGSNDPQRIPTNKLYKKKCAFSSFGTDKYKFENGEIVPGIEYSIEQVITVDNVKEIEEWIKGNNEYPKCFKKGKNEELKILYILSLGYLFAHYKTNIDENLKKIIGLNNCSEEKANQILDKIDKKRIKETENKEWWKSALNVGRDDVLSRIKGDYKNEIPIEIRSLIESIYSNKDNTLNNGEMILKAAIIIKEKTKI